MNQVVPLNHSRQFRRLPLVVLLLLLLLLTACFGGGDAAPQDTAVSDQAAVSPTGTMVCSPDCLNQGQCGTTTDGRTVILAHSTQPATRDHDVILANDRTMNILGQEQRTVLDAAGNPFTLNFFLVQPTEGGPNSWVAGSCVSQTTQ